MDPGYIENPDIEDDSVVIPNPDRDGADQQECFETLLAAILGDDFIIERLAHLYQQDVGTVRVSTRDYKRDHGMRSMTRQCSELYGDSDPMIVIVTYTNRDWAGWVHYIVWNGTSVWEPQDSVGYPNEDSWCQTCAIAHFIRHYIPANDLNIPWLLPGWGNKSIIYRHVACRNLAVRIIRMSFESPYEQPHFLEVVGNQIEFVQAGNVVYYSVESFLAELYDPQYN